MPDRTFDAGELRNRRVLKHMSQTALGAVLDMGTNAVSRWETRQATPPPERLPGIAAALDTDLDELFPRSGAPDLADLRCDAGMTQAQTTEVTSTRSPMAVRAAERGKRPLPENLHEALAEAYGVTVQQLLAAQKRSFGHVVPIVSNARRTAPAPAVSAASKLARLRDEVFQGSLPSDADIAAEGNRKAGRPVLSEQLVEDLRLERRNRAQDEILDALALSLDVPPLFFHTADPRVERVVLATRAVRHCHRFTVAGTRCGEHAIPADAKAELRDFINSTFADILGEEADQSR